MLCARACSPTPTALRVQARAARSPITDHSSVARPALAHHASSNAPAVLPCCRHRRRRCRRHYRRCRRRQCRRSARAHHGSSQAPRCSHYHAARHAPARAPRSRSSQAPSCLRCALAHHGLFVALALALALARLHDLGTRLHVAGRGGHLLDAAVGTRLVGALLLRPILHLPLRRAAARLVPRAMLTSGKVQNSRA